MGNGGSVNFETDQSEQDRVAASTGNGKQGPSGAISLQTGFSDLFDGGVALHVGETFGYRNGGEFHYISCEQNT
jgi:hypothetical protein